VGNIKTGKRGKKREKACCRHKYCGAREASNPMYKRHKNQRQKKILMRKKLIYLVKRRNSKQSERGFGGAIKTKKSSLANQGAATVYPLISSVRKRTGMHQAGGIGPVVRGGRNRGFG